MVDNFIDTRVNIYFHLFTPRRVSSCPRHGSSSCPRRAAEAASATNASNKLDGTRSRLLPSMSREVVSCPDDVTRREVTGSPRLRGTAATFGRFFEDAATRAMSRGPPFICQESRVHRHRLPSGAAGLRSRSP